MYTIIPTLNFILIGVEGVRDFLSVANQKFAAHRHLE